MYTVSGLSGVRAPALYTVPVKTVKYALRQQFTEGTAWNTISLISGGWTAVRNADYSNDDQRSGRSWVVTEMYTNSIEEKCWSGAAIVIFLRYMKLKKTNTLVISLSLTLASINERLYNSFTTWIITTIPRDMTRLLLPIHFVFIIT